MKVLGLNGSPRKNGNTEILLGEFIKGARENGVEAETIRLNSLNFRPCQECDNARTDGVCIVNDDMQDIFSKVHSADAIVIASPVFFGSLSAQTKMMIDRFQCQWTAKFVHKTLKLNKKKDGYFLSVEASSKEKFFDNARSIVKNFYAVIEAEYKGELFCPLVDAKGDINNSTECLTKAYQMGSGI